jgi:serine/threonine protein kinase
MCDKLITRIKNICNCCYRDKEINLPKKNNSIFESNISNSNLVLPNYKTIMRLGSGGNSIVYKAQETYTKNLYTYKIVGSTSTALREINILKKLPNSRFFPNYKDHIIEKNKLSIITDYINGIDSFEWLKHNYCDKKLLLPKNIRNKLLKEMLMAVYTLNEYDYCHLDIKFENFILQNHLSNNISDYNLVLIDYGMAHKYTNKLEKINCVCGTIGYTPFELYQGYYNKNSDVWSIGVCFWIMLTGEMPFKHKKVLNREYTNYSKSDFFFPNDYHLKCKTDFNISDSDFYMLEKMFKISYKERPTVLELIKELNDNNDKSN